MDDKQVIDIIAANNIIKLKSENAALQEEVRKFRMALEGLTPGGSEFYNDADYCVEWIRSKQERHFSMIKKYVVKNRALQERLDRIVKLIPANQIRYERGTIWNIHNQILSIAKGKGDE